MLILGGEGGSVWGFGDIHWGCLYWGRGSVWRLGVRGVRGQIWGSWKSFGTDIEDVNIVGGGGGLGTDIRYVNIVGFGGQRLGTLYSGRGGSVWGGGGGLRTYIGDFNIGGRGQI